MALQLAYSGIPVVKVTATVNLLTAYEWCLISVSPPGANVSGASFRLPAGMWRMTIVTNAAGTFRFQNRTPMTYTEFTAPSMTQIITVSETDTLVVSVHGGNVTGEKLYLTFEKLTP